MKKKLNSNSERNAEKATVVRHIKRLSYRRAIVFYAAFLPIYLTVRLFLPAESDHIGFNNIMAAMLLAVIIWLVVRINIFRSAFYSEMKVRRGYLIDYTRNKFTVEIVNETQTDQGRVLQYNFRKLSGRKYEIGIVDRDYYEENIARWSMLEDFDLLADTDQSKVVLFDVYEQKIKDQIDSLKFNPTFADDEAIHPNPVSVEYAQYGNLTILTNIDTEV